MTLYEFNQLSHNEKVFFVWDNCIFPMNQMLTKIQMNKKEYLEVNVFVGLENINDGFDSESIYYFSERDFRLVLDRVEKLGIGIYGIEPWLDGEMYDVMTYEDFNTVATDPEWYRNAFVEFVKSGKKLRYAASYEIANALLTE
jgi:hypothetical protein